MAPAIPQLQTQDSFLKAVIDASPTMMFVVDGDVRILECNSAAQQLFVGGQSPFQRRGGDALQCLQAVEHPDGCGQATACSDCVIRNAVGEAIRGEKSLRRRTVLQSVKGVEVSDIYLLVTAAPFDHADQRLVLLSIEDISVMTELWRVVPICSCCKKIRDDDANWISIEDYFRRHWDLRFTHGYCPGCMSQQLVGRPSAKYKRADP